jgi:hypothetical protein
MKRQNNLIAVAFVMLLGALVFTQFNTLAAQEKQPMKTETNDKEQTIIGTVVKVDSALISKLDSVSTDGRVQMSDIDSKVALLVTKDAKSGIANDKAKQNDKSNDNAMSNDQPAKSKGAAQHFLIDDNEQGKKLASLVGQKVQITGKVDTDDHGFRIVEVSRYTVMESKQTTKKY